MPEAIHEQSLKCLSSWVQFGIPLPDLEPIAVNVFQALNNDMYFDTAIESLVHVFLQHENYKWVASVRHKN